MVCLTNSFSECLAHLLDRTFAAFFSILVITSRNILQHYSCDIAFRDGGGPPEFQRYSAPYSLRRTLDVCSSASCKTASDLDPQLRVMLLYFFQLDVLVDARQQATTLGSRMALHTDIHGRPRANVLPMNLPSLSLRLRTATNTEGRPMSLSLSVLGQV